jgi:hypothetical protein
LSESDLKAVKKEMDKIIRAKLPIRREEVSREEARRRILEQNEPYKLELLDAIQTEPITIFHIGDRWWDLCAGPHVESTGHLNSEAISLQSVAGAYWRGDEKNVMLQVSFPLLLLFLFPISTSSHTPSLYFSLSLSVCSRESMGQHGRPRHSSVSIITISRRQKLVTIARLGRILICSRSKRVLEVG